MTEKVSGKFAGLLIIIGLLAIVLALTLAAGKEGYYIDEYYTYTLSNGSQLGIAIENGRWNDTSAFLSQLISDSTENFRFAQCYENNQNDVHPPLYYFLIHFLSSIFSGVFSKWIGIAVNIVLWIPCLVLTALLAFTLSGQNKPVTILAYTVYAFSPAILSGLLLIRMYVMLQLFVQLYAYLLVCDLKRKTISVKSFLCPVFLTVFAGFLTQYYFVIACFFLSLFYCIALLILSVKNIKRVFVFGATAFAALCTTYFVWPTSIFHIFKGYRGEDSVNSLLSVSNIASRTLLFVGNLNMNVYGGLLILAAAAFIAAIVIVVRHIGSIDRTGAGFLQLLQLSMLTLAVISYFIIIAKIGLKAGSASNRYEYPVYGIFIILTVIGMIKVFAVRLKQNMAWSAVLLLMLIMLISAYAHKQVLYRYTEEKQINDFLKTNADIPMVVINKDDGSYDRRIKDYLTREKVYFAKAQEPLQLADEKIESAEQLIVYIQEGVDMEATADDIRAVNPALINVKDVFTDAGGAFKIVLMEK